MQSNSLASKAKRLRDSPYFDYHTDDPLVGKREIFLVLTGRKPVAESYSGRWVKTANEAHSEPEDHKKLGRFLASLGLAHHLQSDGSTTTVVVSLDAKFIEQFLQSDGAIATGRLFGYPETAIAAFPHDLMSFEAQDELLRQNGISLDMPTFRFSKAHAVEELELVRDWYNILRHYEFI